MFRQLSKVFLSSLERDLNKSMGKEIATMDSVMFAEPRVFAFKAAPNGAFGRTPSPNSPTKFVRVEKPVSSKGMFCA
jgi:hypothetical protein